MMKPAVNETQAFDGLFPIA